MAESSDLDFRPEYSPAIAEVQCPSTPGPQLSIKSPDLSTSSSSEETELTRGDGSQSPPPNCAICLGRCKNKCFTNSCMHQFCFKCLLEWSKVKPECPLCKQTFKAIIHNVKSMDQFEEYLVQQPVPASPVPDVYSPFPIPAHLYPQLPTNINGRMHLYMDNSAMNTLDLTGIQFHTSTPSTNRDAYRPYDRRVMPDAAQLLDMYSQETIQGETGSGSLSQLWRRYVYDRKLYALPMPDLTGRLRESSARFYRYLLGTFSWNPEDPNRIRVLRRVLFYKDNPSQVHRLMPWINRDIVCLLRNTDHDVSAVMEQINSMLLTCNILSPEFRRRLQPFLGTKTLHFIHELNNFARSPFDMNGYDRVVQYSTNSSDEIVIEFSSTSSAGSDVESVNNDTQQEATTSRRANRQQTATSNGSSGGGFNMYTTSSMSTLLQASAINLSTHNRGANGDNSEGTATTSTVELVSAPTAERPTNIVLSSTSSDECEFVLEQKPPHLRTPELVSLNSESDSDVIFVQETKTTPMPSGITKWASTNSTRVRRPQRRRTNPSLNTQSFSTSNSDSDTFQYNDAVSPKKMKIDNWEENAAGEAIAGASTNDPKSSNDDVLTKVKEEFNQGASTSTGLQSRYRGTRPSISRARHYRHYVETSDSDEMDDSDSSSTDSYFTTDASHSPSDSDTSWSKSRRNSNKQSLKRSRQQKVNTTSNSRKSRRQLSSSAKSKRTKSSKSSSAKSSATGRKKKTTKRARRKSPKIKATRRKRRAPSPKDNTTSEDEESQEATDKPQENQENPMDCYYTCNYSSPGSNEHRQSEEDSSPKETINKSRSSTFSPASYSSTSDNNETTEEPTCVSPSSTATATTITPAADQVADSTASMQSLPPPVEATVNHANMAIYSDTD